MENKLLSRKICLFLSYFPISYTHPYIFCKCIFYKPFDIQQLLSEIHLAFSWLGKMMFQGSVCHQQPSGPCMVSILFLPPSRCSTMSWDMRWVIFSLMSMRQFVLSILPMISLYMVWDLSWSAESVIPPLR